MKISNMQSPNGRAVPNQFVLTEEGRGALGNFIKRETFQSYDSIIAVITRWENETTIELDPVFWNYSRTTSKYRNQFLDESTKETQSKIDSGKYKLINLN